MAEVEQTPMSEQPQAEEAMEGAEVAPEEESERNEVGEAEAQEAAAEGGSVEAAPPAEASAGVKRKRGSKPLPSLESLAARIKALQAEADQADAAVTELEAAKIQRLKELEEQLERERASADAAIAAKRTSASSKRAEANRASQEYVKKQSEAALAELEASIPKKPKNVYFLFLSELDLKGTTKERNKQSQELWNSKTAEEKQKYYEKAKEDLQKYNDWCVSDEGNKILTERNTILKESLAASKEALAGALGGEDGQPSQAAKALETPVKRSRPAPAARTAPSKEPALDENVAQEAEKADLLPQLRNLFCRPDVAALGKSHQELLDALKANKGMVNAAKHALLSA